MRKLSLYLLVLLVSWPLHASQPWREITVPTVAEAAATFANPPKEYSAIHWAIWSGQQTKERILADIEHVATNGGGVYMINNSRGLRPKYFTPEYFDLVKFAVKQCQQRGLKVWIEGDAGYPDGFAGGMISRDYPQLGMQGVVADLHYDLASGQTLAIPLPVDTLGILASPRPEPTTPPNSPATNSSELPLPIDGKFKWTAPAGAAWEVTFHGPVADARYTVVAGQTLTIPLPPETRGIVADHIGGGRRRGRSEGLESASLATVLPLPADGQFKWTAPGLGNWELTFVRHVYRSSPTRFVNREDGTNDKDSRYSLIDYLDPAATRTYLKLIYEKYEQLVGDEFGKTILGFRGDETDFTGLMPWTPKLLETFQSQKGYDLQPYFAQFFTGHLRPEAQRAKADYWDVWSGLFRDNFYQPLETWCQAHDMEFMVHLNHEELMLSGGGGDMINNEGSFFRDMRYVGVPGVDNLNQIGPGIVADFPKLAASAAHVNGRALVWDEEGGGLGQKGKFVVDYQLVRGINFMNIRGLNTPAGAEIGWYVSRTQHLLALGRPSAQIALLHPTDSMWLNDKEADEVTLKLVTELLEHQIDFDHIDADELADVVNLDGAGLKNLSGQTYRAVIVPTSIVIQKKVLNRLRVFAAAGGKVVFVGRTPTMVVDRTFLYPETGPPDLSFATIETAPEITARVVGNLPAPDVQFVAACPSVKYIHRTLRDGNVYFFFNESNQPQSPMTTLAGTGQIQVWDATTGTISPFQNGETAKGHVTVPLTLSNYEAKILVIGAPLVRADSHL